MKRFKEDVNKWKLIVACMASNDQISFLFLSLNMVTWNSASGAFTYIWQSKWVGIIAVKTKRTQIHFLSDVVVAVVSLDLKVPNIVSDRLSVNKMRLSLFPQSALHFLLRGRKNVSYAAVSRCLLSYGADVLQANKNGETPLDRCDGTEVEQLIREIANSAGYRLFYFVSIYLLW